jgi:hypothetical protein
MKKVYRDLKEAHPNVDFYLDDSKLYIHKLTEPSEQDTEAVEDLYIVPKGGTPKLFAAESAIIGRMPKSVRTVRIFADAEEDSLRTIRAQASQMMEAQP